ncbi:hypothetical protein A1O1_07304 [Capronia coronata CBS 617.96]|uniref:Uncharacterized protein n=1 Tax=Capronia coronata CBS 617.96 TaxID=1182541 RepID=W9Y207_9EURO|nr:uncharacterized protein A1O1_07304 [Capronia coronata CBS 617.96]EXJ83680.1 hypothetical protein A1O1_07304 [Capronia coronata CBS 617.96]
MNLRNVVKEGWHPKGKSGGKESWRGDFKGIDQVAGWMGKTRDPSKEEAEEHVSRPLSSLKDPALFGPPPKHVQYHGGAALPHEITPQTSGLGAPLTAEEREAARRVTMSQAQEEPEEEVKPRGPPVPYRADRTGLKTDHLPPPPVHRDINRSASVAGGSQPPKPKPSLPPRLPSRQHTGASITPPPPTISPPPQQAPPAYDSIPVRQASPQTSANHYGINQSAVNRLGNAGVSVPGLGIGSNTSSNPWPAERGRSHTANTQGPPSSSPQPATNQLSELQSRFAHMSTNTQNDAQIEHPTTPPPGGPIRMISTSPTRPAPQSQGPTWADRQAAIRTAQNTQRDPSSGSVSDARPTASSVNSFRERHQDSINAMGSKASEWNKKYNVTGRLNSFLEKHSSPTSETPPAVHANANSNPSTAVASPQMQPQIQPQVHAQALSPPPPPQIQSPSPSQPQPQQQPQPQSPVPHVVASIARKPPPPPPPKKPANMHGAVNSNAGAGVVAPPPVPLGTKPSYG